MSSFILCRQHQREHGEVTWRLNERPAHSGDWDELTELVAKQDAGPHTIYSYLPSILVGWHELSLPIRSAAQAKAALAYALEESIACDIESCHVALMHFNEGRCHAAVVDDAEMAEHVRLLTPLLAPGSYHQRCLPDWCLLPWREGVCTVVVGQELAWVRSEALYGCCVPRGQLAYTVNLLAAGMVRDEAPDCNIELYPLGEGINTDSDKNSLMELASLRCHIQEQPFITDLLAFSQAGCDWPADWNLLQGNYKTQAPQSGSTKKYWQATAAVWALILIAMGIGTGHEFYALNEQQQWLHSEQLAQYQKAFPGAQSVNSPRIVLQRELDRLTQEVGADAFLALMDELGQELESHQEVSLESVSFTQSQLNVNAWFPNFAELDTFIQGLEAKKVSVKRDSATTSSDKRIQARLTLSRLATNGGLL